MTRVKVCLHVVALFNWISADELVGGGSLLLFIKSYTTAPLNLSEDGLDDRQFRAMISNTSKYRRWTLIAFITHVLGGSFHCCVQILITLIGGGVLGICNVDQVTSDWSHLLRLSGRLN